MKIRITLKSLNRYSFYKVLSRFLINSIGLIKRNLGIPRSN